MALDLWKKFHVAPGKDTIPGHRRCADEGLLCSLLAVHGAGGDPVHVAGQNGGEVGGIWKGYSWQITVE